MGVAYQRILQRTVWLSTLETETGWVSTPDIARLGCGLTTHQWQGGEMNDTKFPPRTSKGGNFKQPATLLAMILR